MKLIKDNLLKVTLFSIILGVIFLMISNGKYVLFPQENKNTDQEFKYQTEQFADIKMIRYKVPGFEKLDLRQKIDLLPFSSISMWKRYNF